MDLRNTKTFVNILYMLYLESFFTFYTEKSFRDSYAPAPKAFIYNGIDGFRWIQRALKLGAITFSATPKCRI